jgi:hypothetical protein
VLQRGNNTHAPIAVLPGGECEFSGQPKQEPTAEAARVAEYVPAPQSTQDLAPVVVMYLPAPQSVHEAEPRASLYFPAAHSEHASPSTPVYPTLH